MSKAKDLRDEIALLEGKLKNEYPEKRTDLVKVRFVGWEWWTPPPPIDRHPVQRKIKFAPALVENQIYEVPIEEANHKWFKRV